MMHHSRIWGVVRRIWGVVRIEDPEDLARRLTATTWCLCTAFETAAGTIWANDSTSEDAIQEYAVLRPDGEGWMQVESITASWCKPDWLPDFIRAADAGEIEITNYGRVRPTQIDRDHEPCPHCC